MGENNSLIEGILSKRFIPCVHDTQKIFGFVLLERQIVKICFFPLFSRTSSISFSKQPSKNDAIVHGIFFFFFDKFLPFKSFPSDIFLSSKRQKSGSCCNPRGEYKRIFSFFFINFTYKEIKSFAQNELLFRLLPFFGIEILNRGNFSNFTLFLSLILPILIYFLSTWH